MDKNGLVEYVGKDGLSIYGRLKPKSTNAPVFFCLFVRSVNMYKYTSNADFNASVNILNAVGTISKAS